MKLGTMDAFAGTMDAFAVKVCTKCRLAWPATFYSFQNTATGKRRPSCKRCESSQHKERYHRDPERRQAMIDAAKARYLADTAGKKAYDWKRNLWTKYRMTPEQYDELWRRQNGKCAICGVELRGKKDTHVDHDRRCCSGSKSCGKCVRGLLHQGCNMGLGCFHDDPRLLRKAAQYVEGGEA